MRRGSGGLVAFVLLAPVALMACSATSNDAEDVAITACTSDPTGGMPTADGTVTNDGSNPAAYRFEVVWKGTDPEAEVSRQEIYLDRVDVGQVAQWHADSSLNAVSPLTCEIAEKPSSGLHFGHVGGPHVDRDRLPG